MIFDLNQKGYEIMCIFLICNKEKKIRKTNYVLHKNRIFFCNSYEINFNLQKTLKYPRIWNPNRILFFLQQYIFIFN